jgi:hypothetical protein
MQQQSSSLMSVSSGYIDLYIHFQPPTSPILSGFPDQQTDESNVRLHPQCAYVQVQKKNSIDMLEISRSVCLFEPTMTRRLCFGLRVVHPFCVS